ncbi:GNAT family N-acetyltransferase [Sanguibacter sp. Leaf3]|uniref:GNAT family N-acetyltransferase n=1 Tax=Sanguibacter sp. Leaf3 TaxID=1736209 RepID=UPI000A6CEDCB|nr:GNAT family N-acetyltransferase [Sanguibacter sp. Leaf3]
MTVVDEKASRPDATAPHPVAAAPHPVATAPRDAAPAPRDAAPAPRDTAPVTVRLVEPSEHDAVAALLVEAYTSDYDISGEYRASLSAVAERAAEHQVWVAVGADDQLLGTVATPRAGRLISELAHDGELDFRLLGVSPAARGRGVGETLTRHVLDLARERGASRVVMNSGPQMISAHRLYHRLGFARFHERETRVLDDGTRLFAFVLELSTPEAPGAPGGPGAPGASPVPAAPAHHLSTHPRTAKA